MSKLIGVVGGMGPMAGITLMQRITINTPARCDQEHLSTMLISIPSFADRTMFIEGASEENPAYQISDAIIRLENAGAEVIGIACNTSHAEIIYDVITSELTRRKSSVKLLHLPYETCLHIKSNHPNIKRIGVMSTTGTFKVGLYERLLSQHGFEVVIPPLSLQETVIHPLIYDRSFGLKSNASNVTQEAKKMFMQAMTYFKKEEAEAIILACTELSFAFQQASLDDPILIDPLDSFSRALVREAKGGELEMKNRDLLLHPMY